MKKLKQHILESLRIGINDKPEFELENFLHNRFLYITVRLPNTFSKTDPTIWLFGAKLFKIYPEDDSNGQEAYTVIGKGSSYESQFDDAEISHLTVYSYNNGQILINLLHHEENDAILVLINPDENENIKKVFSQYKEGDLMYLSEIFEKLGIDTTNFSQMLYTGKLSLKNSNNSIEQILTNLK